MSEIWGILPPTNQGPKSTYLALSHLRATLTAYIYRMKYDIHKRQVRCKLANYKGSATSSLNDMNFGPQTASNCTVVFTHPP